MAPYGPLTDAIARDAFGVGPRALAGIAAALLTTALPLAATAQDEGTLRIVHPSFTVDWSPLRGGGEIYRWNSLWWSAPIYFDASGEMRGQIFADWTASDDFSEWTFTLDPGATFSDGSAITAEDVAGSWALGAMPSTRNQRVGQVLGGVAGFDAVSAGEGTALEGVTAGDGTVTVRLTAPDPIFAQRLANHLVPIVDVESVRAEDGTERSEWWLPENGPAVSGPFVPVAMDLDAGEIRMEANPNYFGPAPALDAVEIRSIEDAVTATALLQSGEFDAHTELATPTMIQDLGADFASGPMIPKGQHFWFNVNRPPMDDPKVREALILAVDRDGLMEAAFPDGPHAKADQILNAVPGAEDSRFEPYPFDPEAAQAALAASSYGSAEALPRIMMVGISTPANAAAAQYIAEQWRQNLGITAVDMKPQIDAYSGPDQNNVQVFRDDVGTRVPDAVAYLGGAIASGSSNAQNKLGGYANAEIDALLEEAGALGLDNPRRVELAQEAQRLFREDYAFIPWYHEAMSKWAMPNVAGLEKNLDWQVVEPWAVTVE